MYENVDYEFFRDTVDKEIAKLNKTKEEAINDNKSWFSKSIDFVKDNKIKFIVGGSLVVIVITTVIVIKRRRDNIWKNY